MSIGITDLSDQLVVRLTEVLSRRPEYGIGIPSRRWLLRQEEKMKTLPKELLRPTNPLRRLVMKIADAIEPTLMDPQAVLCEIHHALNPFLIRRLFICLAFEVTVHTDLIRSWPGRTLAPELSAFVGRLDSIVALWTEPMLFHDIYGLAPFDGRHVFVKSSCEACCLAAVGASGRALADLRASMIDRMERRAESSGRRPRKPRLYRVVEAWIDHLRKQSGEIGRPEECRGWCEALLVELRAARPQLQAWRREKRHLRRPVYAELTRTNTGTKITPVPAHAYDSRRTRNGIPVAVADVAGAQDQKRAAAMALNNDRDDDIYRPDSLCGYSVLNAARPRHKEEARPGAPEPVRMSGPSNGSPTQSFIRRFEQEVTSDNGLDPYDDLEDERELDERDPEAEEMSRMKVQEWWSDRLAASELNMGADGEDDSKSVITMVHPAFRPTTTTTRVASALPGHVQVEKDRASRAKSNRYRPASEWTDCTVESDGTLDSIYNGYAQHSVADAPPAVPRVPSEYRRSCAGDHRDSCTPAAVGSTGRNDRKSRDSCTSSHKRVIHGEEEDDDDDDVDDDDETNSTGPRSTSSKRRKRQRPPPVAWPAPPRGSSSAPPPPPPPPVSMNNNNNNKKKKPDPRRFLFLDSDAGSVLTEHNRAYIRDRRVMMKDLPPERNPFLNGRARTPMTPAAAGTTTPGSSLPRGGGDGRRGTSSSTRPSRTAEVEKEKEKEKEKERRRLE